MVVASQQSVVILVRFCNGPLIFRDSSFRSAHCRIPSYLLNVPITRRSGYSKESLRRFSHLIIPATEAMVIIWKSKKGRGMKEGVVGLSRLELSVIPSSAQINKCSPPPRCRRLSLRHTSRRQEHRHMSEER